MMPDKSETKKSAKNLRKAVKRFIKAPTDANHADVLRLMGYYRDAVVDSKQGE